jgi:MFS family permease
MAWLTIPALLGPLAGPPIGGFITTFFSWRWIFWINVPIAVLGFILATRHVPNVREQDTRPFDGLGFLLVGPGLAALLSGATLAGIGLVTPSTTLALAVAGAVLLALYVRHALSAQAPLIELRLLRFPSFRASTTGGFLFRIGMGATPFLLPLMLQIGFGFTPFQSGLMTLSTGLGAMAMKTLASRILRRYGFRRVMIANALLSSVLVAAPALFYAGMPVAVIMGTLLAAGFVRSLQFTSINVSAVSDVPDSLMGRVTSFTSVLQELSGSVGVSVAALGLEAAQRAYGTHELTAEMFPPVFLLIGAVSAVSALIFYTLPRDVGHEMLARARPKVSAPAPEPAE